MKHAALAVLVLLALNLRAVDSNVLTLVKTIPLPDVHGRIDHLALDGRGQRLFAAALANDTVEVIDLAAGKRSRTLGSCAEPQGVAFVPAENRLVIANGGSGVVSILDAASFKTIKTITGLPDADNVRYDAKSDLVYVGYGDGSLAVIRAATGERAADIPLAGHPESFQLEPNGSRLFVNVPDAEQVAVVDRDRHVVLTTWPMKAFRGNFPMALDETSHRLFIGCRNPAQLVVLDTTTGKTVAGVPVAGDTDDVFYDAHRKLIYVSCGGGFIDVIEQRNADSYQLLERIPTRGGARTSYFSSERGELYLAVRAGFISGDAEIRVYKCGTR
jgi:DNA-binding beta-propeller fold protein YncE